MTVYHLNLFNDDDVWDEEGQDFADLDAAERIWPPSELPPLGTSHGRQERRQR